MDGADGGADPLEQGAARSRIADGRLEDLLEALGAPVPQQEQPGIDGSRHSSGQRSGAGDEVNPEIGEVGDRRAGGCRPLPAQDLRGRVVRRGDDRGHVAAGPVQVGFDDVQHEARRRCRVERVPAALEGPHGAL